MKAVNLPSLYLSQILSSILSTFSSSSSSIIRPNGSIDYYTLVLLQFFQHILSVPILPNRIPLTELPKFVSRIPWADLPLIALPNEHNPLVTTMNDLISSLERSSRPHVLANLLAFLPPRYSKLPGSALASYLEMYTALLDGINIGQLVSPQVGTTVGVGPPVVKKSSMNVDSSDTDDDSAMDVDVPHHSQPIDSTSKDTQLGNVLDSRTISRLATLSTPGHLSSLLSAISRNPTSREQFFRHVLLDISLLRVSY
jgi:ubiquitin-protein ligase E3 C